MRRMPATLLGLVLTLLLPGGRFNAYFTPAFTDAAYQKEAAAKILKAWKPVAGAPAGTTQRGIALSGGISVSRVPRAMFLTRE